MRRWGRRTVKPGVSYYFEELGNQERRVRRIARLLLAQTNSSLSSVDLPSVNNAFTRDSSGGGLGDPALLIDSRKLSRVRGSSTPPSMWRGCGGAARLILEVRGCARLRLRSPA